MSGHSTCDNIFILHSLISLYHSCVKKRFCCFVDFSKAFNIVWRAGLWQTLLDNCIDGKCSRIIRNMYRRVTCSRQLPVLDSYARESFDINRGKRTCLLFARILPTEHHLASQEGRNGYATYQGMYEHNLYSLRYLCTFSYSKNNSKFTESLLKTYVCDVNKTLLSMKVKYVYVIQNRKYTGGTVQKKTFWNTVRVISYQFYLYINVRAPDNFQVQRVITPYF